MTSHSNHLRLVPRRKPRYATLSQSGQRQLAWALYITEGYIANMETAIWRNAGSLEVRVVKEMRKASDWATLTAAQLRKELAR